MSPDVGGRRPTIRDVAARAGVSTASASLVLRKAHGVSDETRRRVEKAIVELGYRPLASARAMRGKTFAIGVMISDIQNPFFADLLDGIVESISDTGYDPLIGPGGTSASSQFRVVQSLLDRQMDGIILIAPVIDRARIEWIAKETPLVVVGRHGPADTYDTVAGDDIRGSRLIVDHLVELGHERISYLVHSGIDPADDRRPEAVRERGYVQAMEAHGLGPFIDVIRSEWNFEGGRRAAEEIGHRRTLPTAVHAGADVAAFGLMDGLATRGIPVPRMISVAGYDNTSAAAMGALSLTSVDQSGHEMGETAARLLLERVEGRTEARHTRSVPHLVIRTSTGEARQ